VLEQLHRFGASAAGSEPASSPVPPGAAGQPGAGPRRGQPAGPARDPSTRSVIRPMASASAPVGGGRRSTNGAWPAKGGE
jgi:hypothetical protein